MTVGLRGGGSGPTKSGNSRGIVLQQCQLGTPELNILSSLSVAAESSSRGFISKPPFHRPSSSAQAETSHLTQEDMLSCRDPKADLTFVLQLMVPGPPFLALTIAWSGKLSSSQAGQWPSAGVPAAGVAPQQACSGTANPFQQLLNRFAPLPSMFPPAKPC